MLKRVGLGDGVATTPKQNWKEFFGSTTFKVAAVATGAGGIGLLCLGAGAAAYFTGGQLFLVIGIASGGVVLDAGSLLTFAILGIAKQRQASKGRRGRQADRAQQQTDRAQQHEDLRRRRLAANRKNGSSRVTKSQKTRYRSVGKSSALTKDDFKGLSGSALPVTSSNSFSRTVFCYKDKKGKPIYYAKLGGNDKIVDDGSLSNKSHGIQHPMNDYLAYRLDCALGLGVVPKTHLIRNVSDFERLSQEATHNPKLPNDFNKRDWVVIVQEAVTNLVPPPNCRKEKDWIKNISLNVTSANKGLLLNIILGCFDNDISRVENSGVTNCGTVFEYDNEGLGLKLKEQAYESKHKKDENGSPLRCYSWLLDHSTANQPFSQNTINLVNNMSEKKINEVFRSVERDLNVRLDSEVKKNILRNLKDLKKMFNSSGRGNDLTPRSLFKKINPKFPLRPLPNM